MTWLDWVWELIDNALFLAHCAAVVLLGLAAIACPIYLHQISTELVAIREQAAEVQPCQCRRCDDDGPGPVLPRVLPRLRNLREEAGE